MIGYRESEQVVMCDEVHPNIIVPFAIHECSNYYDRNRPTWKQMEDLAITVTPGPLKPVGFKTGLLPLEKVRVGPAPNEAADDDDE